MSAVMLFTMIPFMGVTASAANANGTGDEYVSLPITIRDYAADGMLFEWNDMGNTGTTSKLSTYSIRGLNVSDSWFSNYTGLRVYTAGCVLSSSPKNWHCLYFDSNGNITKV